MTLAELRKRFLDFYRSRGHAVVPSVSLVPDNDPSTLFTSSGMQPLIPYLLGEVHPEGKRVVNSQRCFRAQDIEEVGDNRHTTYFEMLGNWSFGDYFKAEQLPWVFEFLTKDVGLDPKRLYVSVFEGQDGIERDDTAIAIWKEIYKKVGMTAEVGERIFVYDAKKNWWSRSGVPAQMPPGEPGGPDSEIFFEFPQIAHDPKFGDACHPNCDCGRFVEIGNSVFMQYQKQPDGSLKELAQKNVDFGGGLERIVAATNDDPDVFLIDVFVPLVQFLEQASGKKYGSSDETTRAIRVICDHIRAATMIMTDGAYPSNKTQGYVVRRLIRRAIRFGKLLGVSGDFVAALSEKILDLYKDAYPVSDDVRGKILEALRTEEKKFSVLVSKGLREIDKIPELTGSEAFRLFETFGFPWEMTEEIARERGQQVDRSEFEAEFRRHQEQSRTAASGMFKGGLADHSEAVVRLHTATHLLHQALRTVLGTHVQQKGSNITADRLRFDFAHGQKVTAEEIQKVEAIVNEQIGQKLPIGFEITTYQEAIDSGALAFFGERYPEKVKVYSIGTFSREICGGPHVENLSALGRFKVMKEEASSAGVRRVYATLEGQ